MSSKVRQAAAVLASCLMLWMGAGHAVPPGPASSGTQPNVTQPITAAPSAVPAITLHDGLTHVLVDRGVDYLIEPEGAGWTREHVTDPAHESRWTPYPGKRINLSRELRPVWLRFRIDNHGPGLVERILSIDWPLLEDIQAHVYDLAQARWRVPLHGGAAWGDDGQMLKDPAHLFPLRIEVGQSVEVVLRVQTNSPFFVPLEIWERTHFQTTRYDHVFLMGWLFGILGIMLLYNASLALFTRERSYLWYSIYLVAIILYELAVTGYGALYLWGRSAWFIRHAYEVFACLSFLGATVFFRKFLDLANQDRHLRWMNSTMIAFWCVALVLLLLGLQTNALWQSINLVGMLGGFVALYASVYLMAQGSISARYFALAWLVLISGTFLTLLSVLGVVDGNLWIDNAQHLGFVVETLFLSVALADRIRRDRLYREASQREALELTEKIRLEREEKIVAQQQALVAQQMANELLERRVSDRTGELERAMNNLEMANTELAKLSVTDALTRVFNRRHFDDVLAKEHERSVRMGTPLALLLADIDHFKSINDTFGHLAGDECLRLVSSTLQQVVARTNDLVARYGGEEFAMILPGTTPEHALEVAERVRLAVEGLEFIYRGARVRIRLSLGVAAAVVPAGQSVSDFIAQADAALYKAKTSGRNRVMLAV